MQPQVLPLWIAVLSALLTPTIAIVGSVIAYLQWKSARQKVNLELFEMRYGLLKRIDAPLREIVKWTPLRPEVDTLAFVKLLNEGFFVFGKNATKPLGELLEAFNEFYRVYTECLEADGLSEDLARRLKATKVPLRHIYSSLELKLEKSLNIL